MKHLLLLLLLTVACTPKQQAVVAMEAIASKQEPIENLLFEAGTPPSHLPFIKAEEIHKLRTPIEDMAINHRLVRVQDNFAYLVSKFDQFSDNSRFPDARKEFINEAGNLDIKIQEYFAIYLDPQTMDYYQELSFPLPDNIARSIDVPQLKPMEISNRDRFNLITNLEPSLRIYADSASRNKLWGQKLFKIPDLYKGWTSYEKYLYADPENKIKVVVTPLTNGEGLVCYKAIHPVTMQIFYAARSYQNYEGIERELAYNLYPLGSLSWFTDTPDEIWQEDSDSFYK